MPLTAFEQLAGCDTYGTVSADDAEITPETLAIVRGYAREVHIPDPDAYMYEMSEEDFERFLATRGR